MLGQAILFEAALSFLGLGVQPPAPAWGSMLRTAYQYIEVDPSYALFPGAAIFLTVLAFNLLGDGLREALDRTSGVSAEGRHEDGAGGLVHGAARAEVLAEPVRAPGDGEVTVRTLVSLISAGTELKYYRGHAALR